MRNKNNSPETKPILDIKRKDASCVLDKSQDTIINEILVSEDIIILDNYNNMQLKKLIKKAIIVVSFILIIFIVLIGLAKGTLI